MPVLATNKRAEFDYTILDKYEAGLVLFGHEVKSVRAGHISLKGSYISARKSESGAPEFYLINAHISLYKFAGELKNYDPTRPKKLLLSKKEINYLLGKQQEKGLTLIPLKIYTKHSFLKLEFGIGQGKKKYDKREAIKKKDIERDVRTLTKRR